MTLFSRKTWSDSDYKRYTAEEVIGSFVDHRERYASFEHVIRQDVDAGLDVLSKVVSILHDRKILTDEDIEEMTGYRFRKFKESE